MECPRPRPFGMACWLRWTAPTPWHCRSPGSTAPARPVSERRWTSTPPGSRRSSSAWVTRLISSGTIGAAGSWSGWSRPGPSWSDPGSPTPPASATSSSSGTTSPRSGRHRRRGKTSGTSSWRHRHRSGPVSSRCSGCPRRGPRPGIAHQPHYGRLHPRPVPFGRGRRKAVGPGFRGRPSPGLVIIPGEDPFLSAASATRAAAAGAGTGRPRRARPLVDAPGPCPRRDRPARVLGHPGLTPPAPKRLDLAGTGSQHSTVAYRASAAGRNRAGEPVRAADGERPGLHAGNAGPPG